jgi:hypothetical protein
MIGHGRPRTSHAPDARCARAGPWLCAAALTCLALSFASAAVAAETTLELRIAWGGGAERVWHGSIRLSQGSFGRLQPLGIEADEPGSIWFDRGAVEIHSRSVRAYDGIDLSLTADTDARLLISLANETDPAGKQVEIPLRDLLYQPHNSSLDANDNHLLISRSPGDRLRVVLGRENLVFAPGDKFQFELGAHLLEATGAAVRFRAVITGAGGQQVWNQEYESGDAGTMTSIELRAPETEGVYDLTISAVAPRGRSRLQVKKSAAIADRKIQFVVVDQRAAADPPATPPTRVLEINPMHPRWWERLGNLPLVGGFRTGPLGNGESAPWEHPTLGPLVQLGPGGTPPRVSWEAYPLPISKPGQAHILEVEYPTDVPQSMGISLIEPNAAGAIMPIGLDSGVYVSDEEAYVASGNPAMPPKLAKHRVVFWPRTKTPLLLITNRRDGARAVYGKITVLGGSHSQFNMLALNRGETGSVIAPAFPTRSRPERIWAGYLDRPLFVENFSAPEALDAASHRCLDDWNTIYQGGTRLTKYLKYVGYTGLMMSAFADGSTIYPSRLVEPTPRYDTGVFFSSGQDPVRKDALELLFRLFDREDLTLIPALSFASPLPELEVLKRVGGPEAVGIEWIGPDGAPWLANRTPRQGLAPYYNILHERVQEAMLRVARELLRYGDHASFGGLGLQLSPEGYAQLPGEAWGFDDHTIARFEREMHVQVPGSGRERFAARAKYLAGPGHEAWIQWRAGVVSAFHVRLERELVARRPNAKLYLAGGNMLENGHTQARLRPALLKRAKLDDALVELGLRAPTYREHQSIVLLRPQHLRPTAGPLAAQAAELETNLAPEMDRLFASSLETGSVFFHEPQKARITSFDAKSPFGAANTYTWLVSQMSPAGERNRRRFIHSLATLDSQAMFDGGWLLSLGQEESLKEVLSVYRQLPMAHFETVSAEFQPTIRTLTLENKTYIYAVNDSPWELAVSLNLDLPREATMEGLGDSRGMGPLVRRGSETNWKLTLRPFDLVAARFSVPNVRVRNPSVTIPEYVRQSLERRIKDLSARVGALTNPQPLAVLENPSFEAPPMGETIPGWTANVGMGGSVALDPQHNKGGGQSIRLISRGQPTTVTSAPFRPTTTGRIAIDLFVRTLGDAPPRIRVGLEAPLREGRFDQFGLLPAVATPAAAAGQWVRYNFPVEDVPTEGLGEMSVRLELLSAGEVWIDDVQVYDLSFSDAERRELLKLITLASVKLKAGQLADCARLLEGYWPQFLVANVPLTQGPAPLAQRPPAIEAPAAPAKKPTVLENIKGYLPRMPQF